MQLASSARIPDGFMAAMPQLREKPHQGLPGRNPALYQGPTVSNSTTALGLRGQAELNRVGSCSTGKERDAESGNDYFMARYYSSAMGRFMSPDWSAQEEPVPYAKLDNPQSLNLYAYVLNNPLILVDTDGHKVTFASEGLEKDFTEIAKESPSFRAELAAARADDRTDVIIREPGVSALPDHAPADALVTAKADGTGPVKVVITAKVGDKEDQAHEMGHEKDARTNTKELMKDGNKTANDKGGPNALPHNDRPEEKRADAFKKTVNQERKQYQKEQKQKKKDGTN